MFGNLLADPSLAACLDVKITTTQKAENAKTVLVGVYREADPFPKPGRHLVADRATIRDGTATIKFQNIPAGRYALASGLDRNSNGMVDVNFLGLPTEPVAFSMNARASLFGPPRFIDAAFEIKEGTLCRSVTISF